MDNILYEDNNKSIKIKSFSWPKSKDFTLKRKPYFFRFILRFFIISSIYYLLAYLPEILQSKIIYAINELIY